MGDRVGREGVDIDAAAVSAALADRHLTVQTSRPPPAEFATTYRAALTGPQGWCRCTCRGICPAPGTPRAWRRRRLALIGCGSWTRGRRRWAWATRCWRRPTRRVGATPRAWRRQRRTSRGGAGCSSAWTPWTGCAAAAESARRPRWSGVRWRSSRCCTWRTVASCRWSRCGRPRAPRSGWWSWRCGLRVTDLRTWPCTTSVPRSGPRSWPSGCASEFRGPRGCWCPRSAP